MTCDPNVERIVAAILLRLRPMESEQRLDVLATLLRQFPVEFGELLGLELRPRPGGPLEIWLPEKRLTELHVIEKPKTGSELEGLKS